jgi:hypothetical protein
MSAELYAELAWLPRAPEDFAGRCRSVFATEGSLGLNIQALARHALDENQLSRLAKLIAEARQRQISLSPLVPFRLASSATRHRILSCRLLSRALLGTASRSSAAKPTSIR